MGFFPTLIVFPTDMERLTTYGGICSDIDLSPTDIERLTTYLTAYGGIFSDIDRFPYRHGTSDGVSDGVWWNLFRH